MKLTSEILERAIDELARLPGVGRKSAQRMAMFLLKQPEEKVRHFADTILQLREKTLYCSSCYNITDNDPCAICSSSKRQQHTICVVEDTKDVYAIERTNEFTGVYHVLGGVISPLDNIGPDKLRIKELLARVHAGHVDEIILALNPDTEGEATSFYLQKMLKPFEVNVSRIAQGIPMGTELEFIDEATLSRAFAGRASF